MSFLIDTDICSAHLKGVERVNTRFLHHSGAYVLFGRNMQGVFLFICVVITRAIDELVYVS